MSTIYVSLVCWLWAGVVLGVSFIATPAKFLAPSLSLPHALEVGRATFYVLRWIECGFIVLLIAVLLLTFAHIKLNVWFSVIAVILCLLINYVGLQPALDERTKLIIAGEAITQSSQHKVYIVIEMIKFIALMVAGWFAKPDWIRL